MIEQFLDYSEHFGPVFKMCCKQINVDHHVHDGNFSRWVDLTGRWRVTCILKLLKTIWWNVYLKLTGNDFVQFFEYAVFSHGWIFLTFLLHDFKHSIQVFTEPILVFDQYGVAILIQLLVFPWHVHIICFVILQVICSGLLKANHIFCERFPAMTVEIGGQVLLVLGNIRNFALAEHFYLL